MKKLMRLAVAFALALSVCTFGASADETVTGTQHIHVQGYDWNCGVDKTIITLSEEIDEVSAETFTVVEDRVVPNWAAGGKMEPAQVARKVTAAYTSDAAGNKVEGASKYVTLELYCDPNVGSPLNYSVSAGTNSWSDPYNLMVSVAEGQKVTSNGKEVALTIAHGTYDNMSTSVDHIKDHKTTINGTEYDYSDYTPTTGADSYGLVVWLHGAGEGGHCPNLITLANEASVYASPEFQALTGGNYVLYPQSPTMWMDNGNGAYLNQGAGEKSCYTEDLMTLIDNYVKEHEDIDPSKIVIGGCSNGGFMTVNMILNYPDYFAAAFPVCEAYTSSVITDAEIQGIKDMPIWFTHALNDPTVNINTTTLELVAKLKAAGAENVITSYFKDVHDTSGLYNDAQGNPHQYSGHWSWIYVFNNECVNGETSINEWIASFVQAVPAEAAPEAPSVPTVGIHTSSLALGIMGLSLAAGFLAISKKRK